MSTAPSMDRERDLAGIQDYWQRLRRGENSIPFSDDIRLASLSNMTQDVLLIEVYDDPVRFRVDIAGGRVEKHCGEPLAGKFLDEIPPRGPLDGLPAHCQDVLRARAPSYQIEGRGDQQFVRLVLPFWGNGHVDSCWSRLLVLQ